ncbi:type VI secretion system baseplate subunit TssE [Rhizobium laguerreae]|jgi:type VI secretion system protein ImpF|uniref:Type VI secretion system baseplate subunit TssE n=1 Tax=Rhizobium laguerreae TaxID=1076926 RepID=A0AB35FIF7_9HYPH|nr:MULTISPECIES: type VI secretion system baseplate subunit TssE [Rhizobium]AHF87017.1 type VI secretion protein [Rhizobium leguminosarum bv. trifolii WSM1689]MBY3066105.1 type VI secretion system baseplate subunit TssE [Rhizobium laguerreae]MBY3072842.1 type VI secretion system baseplate subunit TssE [Rhizobium laguerreae]MBY3079127.1 type VI secretion system baseplate subunit TssE [Rhizobium laguerreae]MBY3088742.1 type VI secretion system baseplate subunit TssE [Rhizobium laguerreae]
MVDPLERYRLRDRVLARSILDRLIDEAPDRTVDPPMSFVDQVRDVREAIRRDLEALLNTRRCPATPPAALSELRDALVSYGVDGIVSANLMTDQAKLKLAQAIERRIALFETRLSDVRVTILKSRTMTERALRMRIQATFRLHEGMPPISFESTIDPSTQRFLVEAAHG